MLAMWLPPTNSAYVDSRPLSVASASSPNGEKGNNGSQLRQWSSVIGIVTAIVGNILISFALNTQRYAHIRIERDYTESLQLQSSIANNSLRSQQNYGTAVQETIARDRTQKNATASGPGGPVLNTRGKSSTTQLDLSRDDDADDERQPLRSSFGSDDTLSFDKDANDDETRKSYLKSGYWWIGIILMTIGEAGNFLAYGFAPASIVSPLGVVALISNCLIAPLMLKERFRQRDFWGVLVAIAGAVTVVASAKNSETKMGPNDIWNALKRWEFLTYLGITAAAILALMYASSRYGDRSIFIDLGLVGLFGGYTAISTKGVASLLSDTLLRIFTFPISYLLVTVLVFSALMQIHYVNRSLQRFDSTQVIPTQFVLFTISVIIGSAVLYREFESTTARSAGEFVGGCIFTFFGVYLITSARRPQLDDDSNDVSSEFEARIRLMDEEVREESPATKAISVQRGRESPPTPDGTPLSTHPQSSAGSSQIPSVIAPANATPSLHISGAVEIAEPNPWQSSSDNLPDLDYQSAFARPQVDDPQTPTVSRTQRDSETPFYTPATTAGLPTALRPTAPGPAVPQIPTKAHRTAGPSKPDLQALQRPSTPSRSARNSLDLLTPGPLSTPLSSSLSAVVADSLRRREGSRRRRKRIFRRSGSLQTNSSTTATPTQDAIGDLDLFSWHHTALRGPDLPAAGDVDAAPPEEGGGEGTKKNRLRGFSDVLGELIGGRRKRKRNRRDDEDDSSGSAAVPGT